MRRFVETQWEYNYCWGLVVHNWRVMNCYCLPYCSAWGVWSEAKSVIHWMPAQTYKTGAWKNISAAWDLEHCSLHCPGTEMAAPCATRLKRKPGSPETRVTNCADQEMVLSPSISFTHVSEKPHSFGKNKQTKIHWTNPQRSAFCHGMISQCLLKAVAHVLERQCVPQGGSEVLIYLFQNPP